MKTNSNQNAAPLHEMADNLENGNIAEAKEQARKHSEFRLSMFFRQIRGWTLKRSVLAAHFLKTGEGWQSYADER